VVQVMRLYARCQAAKALPWAGGVLEQPGNLMELFEVVDQEKARFREDEAEKARNQSAIAALKHG